MTDYVTGESLFKEIQKTERTKDRERIKNLQRIGELKESDLAKFEEKHGTTATNSLKTYLNDQVK